MDWTEEMQRRRAEHMALDKPVRTAAFKAFSGPFLANARQLASPRIAVDWFLLGVSGEDAAAWANLGCMPGEAADLIAGGVTPQTYGELEDHAAEQVGGHDALAALRVAELLGSGELLGPDDVVTVEDPFEPGREIIVPREDL